MAPPHFSMYAPGSGGEDGPSAEPIAGASRARDPGYLASARTGTALGRLRARILVLVVAPLMIAAIIPLIVRDGPGPFGDATWWCYLLLAATALAGVVVGPRTPRPMRAPATPPDEPVDAPKDGAGEDGAGDAVAAPRPDRETPAQAMLLFRQALLVRFGLAEGVILLGLALAVIAKSEPVFFAGLAMGYPLLLWLAVPTTATVDRIRRRLEAGGARTDLWGMLLAPDTPRE